VVSPGNVEIVRRIYEARLRSEDIEQVLEFLDPEVELVTGLAGSFTGASYRGHSGVRQWLDDAIDAWEDFWPELIEFTDAGDCVVVDVRWHGRGRASSIEVDRRTTQIWTFRAGRVVRMETFMDRALALQAAGLQQ
jgi:ketosteroid isomerase-like protein